MLHPVGKLPASVYWRRRLVLLVVLVALLGGGGWAAYLLMTRSASAATRSTAATRPAGTPALERVVPPVAGLLTPTRPAAVIPSVAPRTPAGPRPGGPCSDAMIGVAVRAPASAAVGSKPTFTLVVGNISAVPCVRALDKGLQEIVLLDAQGHRTWGSNDCFPEASSDHRLLAPHQAVALPIVWGGLTSAPGCKGARVPPHPGAYVLRGRIAGKAAPNTPFRLA
ncbi:MAG: hypothetical protein QOJ68_738 [Blastococcus sp.]|nr:hypothetical protein [Blastococcus sp.]